MYIVAYSPLMLDDWQLLISFYDEVSGEIGVASGEGDMPYKAQRLTTDLDVVSAAGEVDSCVGKDISKMYHHTKPTQYATASPGMSQGYIYETVQPASVYWFGLGYDPVTCSSMPYLPLGQGNPYSGTGYPSEDAATWQNVNNRVNLSALPVQFNEDGTVLQTLTTTYGVFGSETRVIPMIDLTTGEQLTQAEAQSQYDVVHQQFGFWAESDMAEFASWLQNSAFAPDATLHARITPNETAGMGEWALYGAIPKSSSSTYQWHAATSSVYFHYPDGIGFRNTAYPRDSQGFWATTGSPLQLPPQVIALRCTFGAADEFGTEFTPFLTVDFADKLIELYPQVWATHVEKAASSTAWNFFGGYTQGARTRLDGAIFEYSGDEIVSVIMNIGGLFTGEEMTGLTPGFNRFFRVAVASPDVITEVTHADWMAADNIRKSCQLIFPKGIVESTGVPFDYVVGWLSDEGGRPKLKKWGHRLWPPIITHLTESHFHDQKFATFSITHTADDPWPIPFTIHAVAAWVRYDTTLHSDLYSAILGNDPVTLEPISDAAAIALYTTRNDAMLDGLPDPYMYMPLTYPDSTFTTEAACQAYIDANIEGTMHGKAISDYTASELVYGTYIHIDDPMPDGQSFEWATFSGSYDPDVTTPLTEWTEITEDDNPFQTIDMPWRYGIDAETPTPNLNVRAYAMKDGWLSSNHLGMDGRLFAVDREVSWSAFVPDIQPATYRNVAAMSVTTMNNFCQRFLLCVETITGVATVYNLAAGTAHDLGTALTGAISMSADGSLQVTLQKPDESLQTLRSYNCGKTWA